MNILTIDTDYISDEYLKGPIGQYTGESTLSDNYWDIIVEHTRPSEASMSASRGNIRYIFKTFMQALSAETKVVFGVHHDSILNHVPKESKDLYILNIDHHNDIAYNPVQQSQAYNYGVCNEANWVSVLGPRISEYTWIGNPSSGKYLEKEEGLPYVYTEVDSTEARNLIDVSSTDWDLIYVCLSPNYTYDNHWVYFYLLLDLYEAISGTQPLIDTNRHSNHF